MHEDLRVFVRDYDGKVEITTDSGNTYVGTVESVVSDGFYLDVKHLVFIRYDRVDRFQESEDI